MCGMAQGSAMRNSQIISQKDHCVLKVKLLLLLLLHLANLPLHWAWISEAQKFLIVKENNSQIWSIYAYPTEDRSGCNFVWQIYLQDHTLL